MNTEENIYILESDNYVIRQFEVPELIGMAVFGINLIVCLALFIYFMIKRYRNRQYRAKLTANFLASKRHWTGFTEYQSLPMTIDVEKNNSTPMYVVYPPTNIQNQGNPNASELTGYHDQHIG